MDEEALNISIRKFLKKLGIKAQREMEQAIIVSLKQGKLNGNETLAAKARVSLEGTDVDFTIAEQITLAK
mgnify:CR=1 FL=1|tara:strand:+ start:138 stop:347 length:210 start_codon:yes stop_codon:yes gene_type:complete